MLYRAAVQLLDQGQYFQVAAVRPGQGHETLSQHKTVSRHKTMSHAAPRCCWCCAQVRAYDKQAMMPDGLLGSASVDVHHLGQVASPTVPGSGGGRPVQVRRSLPHNPAAPT